MLGARRWLLVVTLAMGLGSGCGHDHKHRGGKGSGASGSGQAVKLRAAATVDTRVLLARLRLLLVGGPEPLALGSARERAPLDALTAGRLDLIIDSLPPAQGTRPRAAARPRVVLLGADTVAVLTNATNPVDRLSLDDLRRVLQGRAEDWKQLRGPRLPLIAYTLSAGSDVTALLWARLTAGKPFDVTVRQVADVDTLLESVRRTPGALGLVATYQIPRPPEGKLTPEGIKMLALSQKVGTPGYLATDRAAATQGQYPLLLPVVLVVGLDAKHPARPTLDQVLRPKLLPHLSARLGLVPLPTADRQRVRQAWEAWNR
jgi:hypothetical protein